MTWNSSLGRRAMWSDEPRDASAHPLPSSCVVQSGWWRQVPVDSFPTRPPSCGSLMSWLGGHYVRPSTIATRAVAANCASVAIRRPI